MLKLVLALLVSSTAQSNDNTYAHEMAAIRMIESSNGQNTNHKKLKHGLHGGTQAGGHYGIMPITAREELNRNKRLQAQFPKYLNLSNSEITDVLNKDRVFDDTLALILWKRMREHYRFGPRRAACAWFRGPHSKICADTALKEKQEYVIKFEEYLKQSVAVNE